MIHSCLRSPEGIEKEHLDVLAISGQKDTLDATSAVQVQAGETYQTYQGTAGEGEQV